MTGFEGLSSSHPGALELQRVAGDFIGHLQAVRAIVGVDPRTVRLLNTLEQVTTAAIELSLLTSENKCDQGVPFEDIYTTPNQQGDLVLRCKHNPYHEWNMQGSRLR